MASIEELRMRLERAAGIENTLDRRLWVLAVITDGLSPTGVRPVLVGGAAVEFYTLGGYATKDMDAVLSSELDISPTMRELGFDKHGRFWIREDIEIALETPPGPLAGDPERVTALTIDGLPAYVIGIEDLIVDRLNAFVHWKSAEDGRWASRMLDTERDAIDWGYLRRRAREEGIDEAASPILEGRGDQPECE